MFIQNEFLKNRTNLRLIIIVLSITVQIFLFTPLIAETKFTLVLTSNLQGRFSLDKDNQDDNDPMLLLAQSIIKERENPGFDLYLDLGNAFYPGTLSRYSYGSVVMDFFSYLNCGASLVSSRDISIGLSNLEFLSKGRSAKLLSANITKDNQPVFTPYIVVNQSGKRIGIIGVSSADGLFDIAEKKVLNISFREYRESIKGMADKLKNDGCDNLILLSGLSYRNNLELMQAIPEVNLIISGGDSSGNLFSIPSSRVDLEWGRSVVTLLKNDGYYRLELELDERITVKSMSFNRSSKHKTSDPDYLEFANRLSLWKNKFKEDENNLVAEQIKSASITDETVANMLRHRYRSEIGIIEKYSILPHQISGPLYYSTIIALVNNDYPIFTYRLTGADLVKVSENGEDLVIEGLNNGRVQNYPVSDTRTYSVCSTQFAYDRITRILRKQVAYTNTWKTLQDEIEYDLKTEKCLTSENFDYLDDRFRILVDIKLSNFYDRSEVRRGETIDTPPGKPEETYRRWGMEDTLNITMYNMYHQLILSSYIYFIKQDEEYLQNLLRGTLLYTYSPNSFVRPYHKSQVDTVLLKVEDRVILNRETIGISLSSERITGKLGAGYEDQIQDQETPRFYGIETLLDFNYPFPGGLTYYFKLDSFISRKEKEPDELKTRSEITNTLSYKINTLLGVSVKYKWFRLYSREIEESYKYSQVLFSLDLNTDFKLF
jgi:hypothetical protein